MRSRSRDESDSRLCSLSGVSSYRDSILVKARQNLILRILETHPLGVKARVVSLVVAQNASGHSRRPALITDAVSESTLTFGGFRKVRRLTSINLAKIAGRYKKGAGCTPRLEAIARDQFYSYHFSLSFWYYQPQAMPQTLATARLLKVRPKLPPVRTAVPIPSRDLRK